MKDDADKKMIAKVAKLGAAYARQAPTRIKHTATNKRTGEVMSVSFWEPDGKEWRPAPPEEAVH